MPRCGCPARTGGPLTCMTVTTTGRTPRPRNPRSAAAPRSCTWWGDPPVADRTVVAWSPDFPVIACGGTGSEPVAVVDRDMVVACSAAARADGVRRRMRLRSAQACSPQLRVVERDLVAEVRAFERVAAHLEATVMPRLEVIRP